MSGTAFELWLDKAMAQCAENLLKNPFGRPDVDTALKAKHAAFSEAKQKYREFMRTDDDGDKL
jgi:hypothetical protein